MLRLDERLGAERVMLGLDERLGDGREILGLDERLGAEWVMLRLDERLGDGREILGLDERLGAERVMVRPDERLGDGREMLGLDERLGVLVMLGEEERDDRGVVRETCGDAFGVRDEDGRGERVTTRGPELRVDVLDGEVARGDVVRVEVLGAELMRGELTRGEVPRTGVRAVAEVRLDAEGVAERMDRPESPRMTSRALRLDESVDPLRTEVRAVRVRVPESAPRRARLCPSLPRAVTGVRGERSMSTRGEPPLPPSPPRTVRPEAVERLPELREPDTARAWSPSRTLMDLPLRDRILVGSGFRALRTILTGRVRALRASLASVVRTPRAPVRPTGLNRDRDDASSVRATDRAERPPGPKWLGPRIERFGE